MGEEIMLYSSDRIFIHIPKTGGTSIRNYLKLEGWKSPMMPLGYKAWWHRPYFMCPSEIAKNKKAVAIIRNPWDFYVSYWAYKPNKNTLSLLYKDKSFKSFLKKLLTGDITNNFHLPQKIQVPIVQIIKEKKIGLLSFYYFYMLSNSDPRRLLTSRAIFNVNNFKTKVNTYKLENLNKNFSKIFNMRKKHQNIFNKKKKSNQSSRNKNYRVYYTSELCDLVAEREQYLIRKFDYSF